MIIITSIIIGLKILEGNVAVLTPLFSFALWFCFFLSLWWVLMVPSWLVFCFHLAAGFCYSFHIALPPPFLNSWTYGIRTQVQSFPLFLIFVISKKDLAFVWFYPLVSLGGRHFSLLIFILQDNSIISMLRKKQGVTTRNFSQ